MVSMRHYFIAVILFASLGLVACDETLKSKNVSKYEGPLMEVVNVNAFYSDSGKVRMNIKTPLQQEYENGNRTFPKGLILDFFDSKLQNNGRLVADSAFYIKKEKLWTAIGNVVVTNLLEDKKLKSEKLHWSPDKRVFYTDLAVKITSPKDNLDGMGIHAKQDLTRYKMGKPKGVITVKK